MRRSLTSTLSKTNIYNLPRLVRQMDIALAETNGGNVGDGIKAVSDLGPEDRKLPTHQHNFSYRRWREAHL